MHHLQHFVQNAITLTFLIPMCYFNTFQILQMFLNIFSDFVLEKKI